MNQPDITTLSKSDLLSEINAIQMSDFPRYEDTGYLKRLKAEYYKRSEDDVAANQEAENENSPI